LEPLSSDLNERGVGREQPALGAGTTELKLKYDPRLEPGNCGDDSMELNKNLAANCGDKDENCGDDQSPQIETKGPEMTKKASYEESKEGRRTFEMNKVWHELERDTRGEMKLRKVVEKGIQLSSRKIVSGSNTRKLRKNKEKNIVDFEKCDMTKQEDLLCVGRNFVEEKLTGRKFVDSGKKKVVNCEALKKCKLVERGKKIFEMKDVRKTSTEDKLKLKTTPMKKTKMRKTEKRSTPSTPSSRPLKNLRLERSAVGEGGGGKMLGSLRLGLTTVSKKIGTKNAELLRKLEICNGGHRPRPEVASPLWAEHQEEI
jgi:hypothetical protein